LVVANQLYIINKFFRMHVCYLYFLLVRLSTTQQPSGNEKGIHEAFTHLALIVGDVTRLKYLMSHTYFATCFSFIELDDGSY
jgi:hypothetical protein